MNMSTLKDYGKITSRLAIAAVVASMFAVPQVSADSMAGGMAASQATTQNSSNADTDSTTRSGGPWGSASSSHSATQNESQTGGPQETSSTSQSGGVGGIRAKTVQETGTQVKTTTATTPGRTVSMKSTTVSSKKPVKRKAGWKVVNYNWKNGKKVH
jgi:hypothetical protein